LRCAQDAAMFSPQNTFFSFTFFPSGRQLFRSVMLWACTLCSNAVATVFIFDYCDGYDVAKIYAYDISVQFGSDVPAGDVGFRIAINGDTNKGYTEYKAYCDRHAKTKTA